MNFSFVDPWNLFLPRDGGHVVSISGSGGKTSLLKVFAEQLEADNVKAILTCTTRTEILDGYPVFDLCDIAHKTEKDLPPIFYIHDGFVDQDKWSGLSADDVDLLSEKFSEYIILVEVDGSAKMPLKYYRPGEPVWPQRTSLAVVVMSMAAVGDFAGEVVHRFGSAEFTPLKDLRTDSTWLWDHSFTLLTAPGGYLDQVPQQVPVVLIMSCMDGQDDSIGMFEFTGKVMENERMPLVVFCETTGETPSFRTSCLREDGDEE